MVEFGNNWDHDVEFDDLLNILDFPMESLEENGLVGDWDISNSQCLGPIPSNVLIGPPTIPNDKISTGPAHLFPGPVAPHVGAPDQKPLANSADASSSCIPQQSKCVVVQESVAFETQSPVSVLESNGSCLGGKSLSIKPEKAIPVRSRSKRVRPAGVNPWLLASPGFSTSQKTSNARKSGESSKKTFQQPVAMDFKKDYPRKVENSLGASDSSRLQNTSSSSHRSAVTKKCTHCESTKTPQWREGPLGPKTLCNACGVRYRSGRLFPEYRPAASPTFMPSLHSNSHKKVVEMRNKGKQSTAKIKVAPISSLPEAEKEEPPTSPQPEFIPMSSYFFDYIY